MKYLKGFERHETNQRRTYKSFKKTERIPTNIKIFTLLSKPTALIFRTLECSFSTGHWKHIHGNAFYFVPL